LSLFHYQCSKQSTSREISAVFDQACQRQERVDSAKHRCVVFMDEAGLPEEDQESLKVLHYLLEGHMSAKAKVGFVAISNHVLDAAKSNRCVILFRQEPDQEEMLTVAEGILFDKGTGGNRKASVRDVYIDTHKHDSNFFASLLCNSYINLMNSSEGCIMSEEECNKFNTFYGLRDFVYLLKEIRTNSETAGIKMRTSLQIVKHAVERNFNGLGNTEMDSVVSLFLKPLLESCGHANSSHNQMPYGLIRNQVEVIWNALQTTEISCSLSNSPRFKLIIDATEDDSILRLLKAGGVTDISRHTLCKLSLLQEQADTEQLRIVSKVKYAASQGHLVVLSQTEPINESFYDLFNQRYIEVKNREGKINYFTNIAVGGVSRRCMVHPSFQCVVHVRAANMKDIPAPFLNRFEKYRLDISDVLSHGWSRYGALGLAIEQARQSVFQILSNVDGQHGYFGFLRTKQSIESVFVDMLPHIDARLWNSLQSKPIFETYSNSLLLMCTDFLRQFTSSRDIRRHLEFCVQLCGDILPENLASQLTTIQLESEMNSCLKQAFQSILDQSTVETQLPLLLVTIVQMTLTRVAAFRLIQVATPESIFINR
jgi:hypothetical protein